MLPIVSETTIDAVKDTLEREGLSYVKRLCDECIDEQLDLYSAIKGLADDIEGVLLKRGLPEPLVNSVHNSVMAAGVFTWKSLKNQQESNELEELFG